MKKLNILFVLLCIGFTTANAQKISFGFKGGLNLAGIYGDNSDGVKMHAGLHLGVMSEFSLTEKFSIQPELVYSQQGANQDVNFILLQDIAAPAVTLKARYNYLNLPVIAKYYVTNGLSIEAGPQVGFLLSAKQKGQGEDVDVKDGVKNIDFGLNVGLGYKLTNGLSFSARYNAGLSNINDVDGISDKNTNGVIQVSIGYFLR
ncbi:porin family protein [Kordia sp.]|uniref:porin family protein n=1 Tax=Kordia sp. TaxID=1965332 RepID=UPI003B5ACD1A